MEYGEESEANLTFSFIAYAAMKMGDYKRVEEYLEYYRENINDRRYPYYSGDSVWIVLTCEEAFEYYSEKENQGIMYPQYE